MPHPVLAAAAMLAVAAVWGATYVTVKDAVSEVAVSDFLAWRFAIAAAAVAAVRPRCVFELGPRGLGAGVVLGLLLAIGYGTQTVGLRTVPASVSGFITGLLVVLTPLVAALWLRERPRPSCYLGVALAASGLCLLSLTRLSIGSGELLTICCALAFAVHIVGVSKWSGRHRVHGLVVVQLLTVAAAAGIVAAPGGIDSPHGSRQWTAVLFTAVAATALAYFLQTWAQLHLSPSRTAVILTMEPVFALLAGVLISSEDVTLRLALGATCVLVAMLIAVSSATPSAAGSASASAP